MRGLGVAIYARCVGIGGLVDVAITTNRAVMWQLPIRLVIESDTEPSGGVVATGSCTIRREIRGHVIRDRASQRQGTLPGSDVTAVAIRRERTAIIVVHMASCARGGYVRPGQREGRGVVVEHPGSPRGDGMACCALRGRGWKTRCDVIRNISADSSSALERRRVAAIAIRGIQCVVAVNVAGCARRRDHRG